MAKSNVVGALPPSIIGDKKLLILVSILVVTFMVDSQIGYIADFIPERLVTNEGIALFIGIAVVFAAGGILILQYVKTKTKESRARALHLRATHIGVTIAQYVLIAIIAFVIAQILVTAQYNTVMIAAALSISYGLWIIMLALLSRAFLAWWRSSRSNVTVSKRNVMVLILALSMIAYVVNGVTGLANFLLMLQEQLEVVTSVDVAFFPEFDPESLQQQINAVYQIAGAVAYVLTWIGTVMLLRPYIHRIGKIKFYAIMGSAMVYYLIQYPLFVLGIVTPTGESDVEVMNTILITSISSVFSGIIFGAAFLLIARTFQKGSALREYMIIAAYGLLLFYVAGSAALSQAAYPPFGLASVSFTGLSCYLIYTGLYSSAISVSQDVGLRQSIRKSAIKEVKFLESMGTAQMEQELQKRVLTIAKKNSDIMTEETGVEPSLSEDDMKQYLEEVLKEIKVRKV
ncbi:MAG TPA: hypothetical protein VE226_01555 [Nitrososphaeraceae archaeon]|nr:hypothetical protein [Nitrososphaeraceae archaeon]